jgi:Domain of unknown function (DUF4258)
VASRRLIFSIHAVKRMFERGIGTHEVRDVLESGQVIEEYPQDRPYPSRLVMGWSGSRPVHVVVADVPAGSDTIVITVYEPDVREWEQGFMRRKV